MIYFVPLQNKKHIFFDLFTLIRTFALQLIDMDKETKELLKRTLTMTDDKLLLKFAKSYAAKDQAFAEAIIEKFLPVENAVDYEKMVFDCFLHKKRGGARRYGPSLDWTTIRKDIKRLLKQLEYLRQQQDGETAAEGALLLLEKLADVFNEDRVYEDYNYQNSRYGNEEALAIVGDVLQNNKYVRRDQKLGMVKRLQRLAKSEVYRTYLPCNIRRVVDEAHKVLLSPDELLKEIDKNILEANYSTDKEYYVKMKISLLRKQGLDSEAEKVILKYIDLEDIGKLRYEQLITEMRYEEAKGFCKSRLGKGDGRWNVVQPWHERLVQLGRLTNDKETVCQSARWLFCNGNVTQEDKKAFFHTCRETLGKDEWPSYRDKMFHDGKAGNVSTDTVFELYEEERLFERMFLYLQKLSDQTPYYAFGSYQNSGGEQMAFFSRYARFLTEVQRAAMIASLSEIICQDSRYANTRDRYAQVASGLHLLSQSCEKGSQQAQLIVAEILRENPKKPAFREEIESYEYSY
jgi:hypothetical protein